MRRFYSTFFVLLVATFMSLSAQTQQVTVTDASGATTTYDLSSLPGSISGATAVTLTGDDWTEGNIDTFGNAIASSISTLESVDMSAITLSGDFTTTSKGFYQLFGYFTSLESVVLPSAGTANEVIFSYAFIRCSKLTSITNLDKFSNVSNFSSVFSGCSSLESITLPSAGSVSEILFHSAFYGCSKLTTITNLDKFTNVSELNNAFGECSLLESVTLPAGTTYEGTISFASTFFNCTNLKEVINFDKFTNVSSYNNTFAVCSSLEEVRLGTDPGLSGVNILDAIYDVNKSCIVYLPSGVTDVPSSWQSDAKFAVPFTLSDITAPASIYADEAIVLPTESTLSPTYAASRNAKWEIKKSTDTEWSEYTSSTTLDISYNGASLRYSVQPYSVDNDNPDAITSNEVDVIIMLPKQVTVTDASDATTTYDLSSLPSSISGATAVTLTGDDWTEGNIDTFGDAIGSSISTLLSVDMSAITLSGTFTSSNKGFNKLFYQYTALETVILPADGTAESVDFSLAFFQCEALTTVSNLDKLTNISLFEASFRLCSSLETITLPEGSKAESVSFSVTFDDCTSLKEVNNFGYFTALSAVNSAFGNCSSLEQLYLGFDPSQMTTSIANVFEGINEACIVYLLVDGATVSGTWAGYSIYALPITISDISVSTNLYAGEALELSTPSITPSYAAYQNAHWEIKKTGADQWEEYTVGTTLDILYNGASLRYSAQPYEAYNENPDTVCSNEMTLSVVMPKLITVVGGDNAGEYLLENLPTSISGATAATLTGWAWTENDLDTFGDAIDDSKTTLESVDMEAITLSGTFTSYGKGFYDLFYQYTALETVILPIAGTAEEVVYNNTFEGCTNLKTVTNLDKFANVSTFYFAFGECSSIESIILPAGTNAESVSFYYTFYNCTNLQTVTNLDSFDNISNFESAFHNCSSIENITLPAGTNAESISFFYTFYKCTSLKTVTNLEKFDNISSLYCTFFYCSSLEELYLGTDPAGVTDLGNTFTNVDCIVYLPSGVVDVPADWQKFGRIFALPITVGELTDEDYMAEIGDILYTFYPSITPSYAAYQNVKWEIKKVGDDAWSEYIEYTELDISYVGAMLRFSVQPYELGNENPDTICSNEVEIKLDCTISFNSNGGSGRQKSQTAQVGESTTLNANSYSRTNYTFAGWSTTADGAVEYADEASLTPSGNITLYAQWTINSFDVSAVAGDGGTATVNGEESTTIDYNATAEFVAVAEVGYSFTNWTDADGNEVSDLATYSVTITEDLSLTANFTKDAATDVNSAIVSDIIVTTNRNIITIHGAEIGATASVYSLTGAVVYSGVISSTAEAITLSAEGVYIVKVNNYITKTVVRY